MLCQQSGDRKTDIAGTCNRDFHKNYLLIKYANHTTYGTPKAPSVTDTYALEGPILPTLRLVIWRGNIAYAIDLQRYEIFLF